MIAVVMRIISMSLQAVLVIGVVFGFRKLFAWGNVSKKYLVFLWIIPFFFLVFPWKIPVPRGFWSQAAAVFDTGMGDGKKTFSDDSSGGLQGQGSENIWNLIDVQKAQSLKDRMHVGQIPDMENIPDELKMSDTQAAGRQQGQGFSKITDAWKASGAVLQKLVSAGEGKYRAAAGILSVVWVSGVFWFFLYGAVSYGRLKKKVLCSVKCDGGKEGAVYLADGIQTPVVLGFVKPRIYLPAGIHTAYREYVVAHENTHIRRKDYITKAAAYVITCLHWFNPVVWFAYYSMAKDMEMACDEETIAKIGLENRKEYASVLLELAAGTGSIFAVPPAFGKGDIKARIQNIMHYKKTAKRAAVLAAAAGIFLTGIFLTADEQEVARTAAEVSAETDGGQKFSSKEPQNTGQGEYADASDHEQSMQLTFEMVRDAFAKQTAGQMDFTSYKNGRKKDLDENASNYYIDFYLGYEDEMYRLGISYDKSNDRLGDIYITRDSDSSMAWIYTVDAEEGERYPNDLEVFLHTKITIDDWLTLELPEGYTLGDYNADVGDCGGALISPKLYQTQEGENLYSAPEHWKYAGCVGLAANPQGDFAFVNGKLDAQHYPRANHSSFETEGVLDMVSAGAGWDTLMVYGTHDLYTAADLHALEMEGIDIDSLETVSEYWYFYFVKEGEDNAYFLSLSAKEFTKTEAIEIARTVKVNMD